MQQHDKLIRQAANKILVPHGLFQKGSSRIWLEDNGDFLTLVEFQPSSFSKGSYANVAVSFLWAHTETPDSQLPFDYSRRISRFVSYAGDDAAFSGAMEAVAERALHTVQEFRQFRDLDYAKTVLSPMGREGCIWPLYNLSMLCFLHGDFPCGKAYLKRLVVLLEQTASSESTWCTALYHRCAESILPQCTAPADAQRMVTEMIRRKRAFLRSKPSFRKLKP